MEFCSESRAAWTYYSTFSTFGFNFHSQSKFYFLWEEFEGRKPLSAFAPMFTIQNSLFKQALKFLFGQIASTAEELKGNKRPRERSSVSKPFFFGSHLQFFSSGLGLLYFTVFYLIRKFQSTLGSILPSFRFSSPLLPNQWLKSHLFLFCLIR